jgi:hypothetical protein
MPYKKRSSSRKHHGGLMKKVGVAVLAVIPILLAPLLVHIFVKNDNIVSLEAPVKFILADVGSIDVSNEKTQDPEIADLTLIEDASSEINGEWRGVCKKNSIHSVEDFQKTVRNDPVLLSHFSGFNWETAKIGKQDEETFAYVSHRKGEVIKQTSKPIRLPKGDGYITDGVRIARTYCCNDINMTPSAGVPKKESPPINMTPSAGVPEEWVPSEPSFPFDPSGVIPFLTASPARFSPSAHSSYVPNSSSIPEPGTMLLMGTGLIVLVAACKKKNSANKS